MSIYINSVYMYTVHMSGYTYICAYVWIYMSVYESVYMSALVLLANAQYINRQKSQLLGHIIHTSYIEFTGC